MIIIKKDTVWKKTSPTRLTDDIQIAPGVKLTLEAGAILEGNGHSITVFGSFISSGAASEKNFIDNLYLKFSSNYKYEGRIDIRNTHINEGGLLNPTGNGSYGNLNLEYSVINQSGGYSYLWYLLDKNTIKNNIFTGNARLDIGIDGSAENTIDIANNVFGAGMSVSVWAAYGDTVPSSHDNAYLSDSASTLELIYDGRFSSSNDYFWKLGAKNISLLTRDRSDDLNIGHYIDVQSIASLPNANIPTEMYSFVSGALPDAVVTRGVLLGRSDASLRGNAYDNRLVGNVGNNIIDGGLGADTMEGGAGDDLYLVDNVKDVVVEWGNKRRDTVIATVSHALSNNVEALTLAGTRAINATGNALANHLIGNGANNVLDGRAGADVMEGGAGNDIYYVDHKSDRVVEAVGGGTDTIVSTVSYALAAGQEVETLKFAKTIGTAALNLTGNAFANTLVGAAGDNVLNGGGGIDAMYGGSGNDTYVVDHVNDKVSEAKGAGTDKVLSSVSYVLKAGQEIEALQLLSSTGTNALNLTGNEFGQNLIGNKGANVLNGGLGNDFLTGGRGADTFVFSTKLGSGNVDHITDFAPEDTIRLVKAVFSALAPGQLSESAFKVIGPAKADADDRILYKQTTGELFYDADGSGKGAAVLFAVLDNKATLTQADFLIA